jgi:hypothetical protein
MDRLTHNPYPAKYKPSDRFSSSKNSQAGKIKVCKTCLLANRPAAHDGATCKYSFKKERAMMGLTEQFADEQDEQEFGAVSSGADGEEEEEDSKAQDQDDEEYHSAFMFRSYFASNTEDSLESKTPASAPVLDKEKYSQFALQMVDVPLTHKYICFRATA